MMKLTNLIVVTALIAGVSAVKISDNNQDDLELLQECSIEKHSLVQKEWHDNMPDIYSIDYGIIKMYGKDAVEEFNKKPHMNGKPDLMIAYHPECPHCVTMKPEVEKLAKKALQDDIDVNIVTINMSKSMEQIDDLGVHSYPTIKLFKNDGKDVKFPRKPKKMENLVEFLKENGVAGKKK